MKTLSKENEIIFLPTGQKIKLVNTTMNYVVNIRNTSLYIDVNMN